MIDGEADMAFSDKAKETVKKLLDLRPENEDDYYGIGGFLVGRKLAFVLVIAAAAVFALAAVSFIPDLVKEEEGVYRVYRYNSMELKFISDKVRILGKSGYTAYTGDVDKGEVTGEGILYAPDGHIVYSGSFDNNMYNGSGKRYYDNSMLWYEGNFKDNLFDGEGTMYREDGTVWYSGDFLQGNMEGEGQLYGKRGQPVYQGTFVRNDILFKELLGKSTSQVSGMYTGETVVYESGTEYCVCMEDIDALYFGDTDENKLDGEIQVSGVYVLSDSVVFHSEKAGNIRDVRRILGEPLYEGNTALSLKDKAALLEACKRQKDVLYGKLEKIVTKAVFDDVYEITNEGEEYLVYLYVFKQEDTVYTFFCRDRNDDFAFYMISQA